MMDHAWATHASPRRNRRSIRLKSYDYSQAGAYFITICAHDRACVFGDIVDNQMRLSDAGRMATECWEEIPRHFPGVALDAFVVMPNHVHGIWVIADNVGATHASPQHCGPKSRSIAAIVGSFKSSVTKRINEIRRTPGVSVWQRNYYEHIVRNYESMNRIREYIINNPLQWAYDRENPVWATHASPQHASPIQKDEP